MNLKNLHNELPSTDEVEMYYDVDLMYDTYEVSIRAPMFFRPLKKYSFVVNGKYDTIYTYSHVHNNLTGLVDRIPVEEALQDLKQTYAELLAS